MNRSWARGLSCWFLFVLVGCSTWLDRWESARWSPPTAAQALNLKQWNSNLPEHAPGWQLRWLVRHGSPGAAANAAIVLAKHGKLTDPSPLVKAACNSELDPQVRQAAVVALASLPSRQALPGLVEIVEKLNQQSTSGTGYHAKIHRLALQALGRIVSQAAKESPAETDSPSQKTELASRSQAALLWPWHSLVEFSRWQAAIWGSKEQPGAVSSPSSQVRQEALELWAQGRWPLPEQSPQLLHDPAPAVRRAYLRALSGDPKRLWQECTQALNDQSPQVRREAVVLLGQLAGSDWDRQAREKLLRLFQNQGELVRTWVVEALAAWKDPHLLNRAAEDESWRVRQAVAQHLAQMPSEGGKRLALRLLEDSSPLVQQAVVQAVKHWPEELRGQVWLKAMASPIFGTRKQAAELLAQSFPQATQFPLTASPQEQRRALAQLRQAWHKQHPPHFRQEHSSLESRSEGAFLPEQRRAFEQAAQQLQRLKDPQQRRRWLGVFAQNPQPALAWLEERLHQGKPVDMILDPWLLQQWGEPWSLLAPGATGSVRQRRFRASRLAALAGQEPLGPVAHFLILRWLTHDSDPLVWQNVLGALMEEASPWAVQLARAATGHASAEVRRRACVYLGRHPQPEHADWLVPRLDDPQTEVVLAATEALGYCENPKAIEPLKRLLLAPQGRVQVEAAWALARLMPALGRQALERLTWHPDPQVRRQAALGLGQFGTLESVPMLLRLAQQPGPARPAALKALTQLTHLLPAASAPQEPEALVNWWKQQVKASDPQEPANR